MGRFKLMKWVESNPGPTNFALPEGWVEIEEEIENWDGSAAGVCVVFFCKAAFVEHDTFFERGRGLHVI